MRRREEILGRVVGRWRRILRAPYEHAQRADGGGLASAVDVCIAVPADSTPRIQEAHTVVGHLLCEIVERELALRP